MGQKNSTEDSRRGWRGLIATRFQVTFSDNVFKTLIIFVILGMDVQSQRRKKISSFVSVNFLTPIFRELNRVRKDRLLVLAFAGNTYFYFAGCV